MHERRDRVERVEQEVGLKLHPQHLQLGLGQLRLEPRRLQFALAVSVVILEKLTRRDDHAIQHEIDVELVEHEGLE